MQQYLSVHDIVWINSTIAGKPLNFDYERLEAAMAAQYSYGISLGTRTQAANLLESLARKGAFEGANKRTALVSTLAFLIANGFKLKAVDSELAGAVKAVAAGGSALEAIDRMAGPSSTDSADINAIRNLVARICSERAEALKLLAEGDS